MDADVKASGFLDTIRWFRLLAAMILAPLVMTFWLGRSVDIALIRAGAHPDGPALIWLSFKLWIVGFGVPFLVMFCWVVAYFRRSAETGRLSIRAIILRGLLVGVPYTALVCWSFDLGRFLRYALPITMRAVPGMLLASLCFYFIAVWRNFARPPVSEQVATD